MRHSPSRVMHDRHRRPVSDSRSLERRALRSLDPSRVSLGELERHHPSSPALGLSLLNTLPERSRVDEPVAVGRVVWGARGTRDRTRSSGSREGRAGGVDEAVGALSRILIAELDVVL